VERVSKALGNERKRLRGARVHLFGVAYKPEVGDVRESPALDIAQLLLRAGAIVSYSDPYVPMVNQGELVLVEVAPEAAFERGFDCAIIATSHREFDYGMIASRSPLIVDTRNALKGMPGTHIHRL
jgi:UDP-N-acetyl-D-glucosamine dehydrogenase